MDSIIQTIDRKPQHVSSVVTFTEEGFELFLNDCFDDLNRSRILRTVRSFLWGLFAFLASESYAWLKSVLLLSVNIHETNEKIDTPPYSFIVATIIGIALLLIFIYELCNTNSRKNKFIGMYKQSKRVSNLNVTLTMKPSIGTQVDI